MKRLLLNTVFFFFIVNTVYPGTMGKISGFVFDKGSKEAVGNAMLRIKELNKTFTSDENGYFNLIMVPPGVYTLAVSSIGYKDYLILNLSVQSDKTTKITVYMEPSPLIGEEVTVTSKRNLMNHDITSSINIVESEKYQHLPKIQKIENLLTVQPGIIKYNDGLHLRGGREGEVLYVLDGIPVKDILYTGAGAIDVSSNSIQELSILNSGFNAEYGNAESGVINIITKNGSDNYSGSFEFSNDGISKFSNDETFSSVSLSGPEPVSNQILPMTGIILPGKLRFFSSLTINQSNTDYKFNNSYYKNFKTRKIDLPGNLVSFKYNDRQNNSYDGSVKLKYDYQNYSMALSYTASGERNYRYDVLFKNRMDSALLDENSGKHLSLKWTHTLSNNAFYNVVFGMLKRKWNLSVNGLTPDKYNPIWYSQDINSDGYNDLSMAQFWSKAETSIYTIKTDFNYQYNANHLFKTGFEINYEEIFATEIQYPGNIPDKELPGEYPAYGEFHWNLNNYTSNGSMFLQDKMEYEGLIVNAGFRLDYFTPGKQVQSEKFISAWEDAAQLKDENGNIKKLIIDKLQIYLSPRLGISHPITEKTNLFFNYGHFYQLPERQYLFRDPYAAKGWIGNPNLKSPRTVCYEFGFTQEFLDQAAISVKGFYKDYFDYIGSLEVGPAARRIFMFYNCDYANAKGFEITISKYYADNFSFDANYTYSTSKGRSESPFEESYTIWKGSGLLPMEVRMPWDQNHVINCLLTYYVTESGNIPVLNSPLLRNFGITLKWNYGSGFPYTPTGKNLRLSKNTGEMPFTTQLDLRVEKKIELYKSMSITIYADCINLLNRQNVKEINPLTGEPFRYGDLFDNTNKRILTYREILSRLDESKFYGMRQIMIGAKMEF